jgi:hypothetical protein
MESKLNSIANNHPDETVTINKLKSAATMVAENLAVLKTINDPRLKICVDAIGDLEATFLQVSISLKKHGFEKSIRFVRHLKDVCKHCILICRRYEYNDCQSVIKTAQEIMNYAKQYNL